MLIIHVLRWTWKKILQCGSAESKTAKLVEDIASECSVELQALKNLEYFELKNLCDDSLDKVCYQQICQAILKLKDRSRKKQQVMGTVCIILFQLSLTEMKIYPYY